MNGERIGIAAGVLWNRLNQESVDGLSVTDLKKTPDLTGDEVLAGLGWLAREGKVTFKVQGRRSFVFLSEAYVP